MKRFFKTFLTQTQNQEICTGTEMLLKGCIAMYQVTDDMFYKDYILNYADKLVDRKGIIKGYENGSFTIENMDLGSTLIWIYEQTGEEKYRLAIDALKEKVREFKVECEESHSGWKVRDIKSIYYVQPFYMEYETKYENKECYLEIIAQFKKARKYLFNSEQAMIHLENDEAKPKNIGIYGEESSPCETVARYLMALIETMDKMSIEIFEHYKLLEKYFKEALKEILAAYDRKSSMSNQQIVGFDEENSLMLAYSIMKACQMKVVLSEKYYGVAERIWNSLSIQNRQKHHNLESDLMTDELWNNRRMFGILMMTYSQYMIGTKTKKIKELGCCYEQ